MPKFFFHVHDDVVAEDEEGMDLPHVEAARQVAIRGARDLACAEVTHGWLNLRHQIVVEDEQGQRVLTISFADAIEIAV